MSEPQDTNSVRRVQLTVEFGDAEEPIRGRLERSGGETVPFSGWLGLLATIENAADRERRIPASPDDKALESERRR